MIPAKQHQWRRVWVFYGDFSLPDNNAEDDLDVIADHLHEMLKLGITDVCIVSTALAFLANPADVVDLIRNSDVGQVLNDTGVQMHVGWSWDQFFSANAIPLDVDKLRGYVCRSSPFWQTRTMQASKAQQVFKALGYEREGPFVFEDTEAVLRNTAGDFGGVAFDADMLLGFERSLRASTFYIGQTITHEMAPMNLGPQLSPEAIPAYTKTCEAATRAFARLGAAQSSSALGIPSADGTRYPGTKAWPELLRQYRAATGPQVRPYVYVANDQTHAQGFTFEEAQSFLATASADAWIDCGVLAIDAWTAGVV